MQHNRRKRLDWFLNAGVHVLLLVSSVSLAYGDCTVGGSTFKLVKRSSHQTYFTSCTGTETVTDKSGARYASQLCDGDLGRISGLSVQTNLKTVKQSFPAAYTPGDYNLPITDLYDPVKNTTEVVTYRDRPTQNEYTLRYLIDGNLLYEFQGTLTPKYDMEGVYIEPFKGTFKTACGEVWALREEGSGASYPLIKAESAEVRASKEKEAAANRKEGKKKTEEEARKLNAFRKTVKVGSKVRVFSGNFQARGLVTESKKDLVKVQFTEQVIQFQWTNIRPIDQWVQRSNLLPPQGGASLY